VAGRVVEGAAAGDQAQGRIAGRAVHGVGGEPGLEEFAHAGDAEDGGNAVRERYVDGVTRLERAQPEEDGRTLEVVDVAFDDRGPDLAGRRRVLVPGGEVGLGRDRRHRDRAVRVDAQVQELRVHADGGDVDAHRHRPVQRPFELE
jgi:hypothetical protein